MEPLEIPIAGSRPVRFGVCLCSTGPKGGEHENGISFDTWNSWDGKQRFCGGVMGYKDVLRLKQHLEEWLKIREAFMKPPVENTP